MESISYVLEAALQHRDNLGTGSPSRVSIVAPESGRSEW
jgi:hypothetical protein